LEFVVASKQLRKANLERQIRIQQQARLGKWKMAFSIVAIALLAAVFGIWQYRRSSKAENALLQAKREEAETQLQLGQLKAEVLVAKLDTSDATRKAYGFSRNGDLEAANEQFKKLLNTYLSQPNKESAGSTYLNLGDVALRRANSKAPMAKFDEALKTAIGKYDEALNIFKSEEKFSNYEAHTYLKKAAVYFVWGKQREEAGNGLIALKKYIDAYTFSERAMKLFEKNENDAGVREAANSYAVAKRFYDDLDKKLHPPAVPTPDS
jgi:tetratricopeptide (TPR) repeat protein